MRRRLNCTAHCEEPGEPDVLFELRAEREQDKDGPTEGRHDAETERYGPFTRAGETVYERPFQWGSKRTGPDLARVGGRYTDEWHRVHLDDPRAVVPGSNMPGFPWLKESGIDGAHLTRKLEVLRWLGHPYSDQDVAGAAAAVAGKTEQDALVAYLQMLGLAGRLGR